MSRTKNLATCTICVNFDVSCLLKRTKSGNWSSEIPNTLLGWFASIDQLDTIHIYMYINHRICKFILSCRIAFIVAMFSLQLRESNIFSYSRSTKEGSSLRRNMYIVYRMKSYFRADFQYIIVLIDKHMYWEDIHYVFIYMTFLAGWRIQGSITTRSLLKLECNVRCLHTCSYSL